MNTRAVQPLPGLDNPTLLASLQAARVRARYLAEPHPDPQSDELVRQCNAAWLDRLETEAARRGILAAG